MDNNNQYCTYNPKNSQPFKTKPLLNYTVCCKIKWEKGLVFLTESKD